MSTLVEFYRRLVDGSRPIHPIVQRRIIDVLLAEKEFGLLGRFASRADLSEESDRLLRSRNEAHVVRGWVRRSNRSRQEIVDRLMSETRVSVLRELAGLPDLPDEAYAVMAKAGSVRVVEALLKNRSVSPDVRLGCVDQIVALLEQADRWMVDTLLEVYVGDDARLLSLVTMRSKRALVTASALNAMRVAPSDVLDAAVDFGASLAVHGNVTVADRPDRPLFEALVMQNLSEDNLKKLRRAVDIIVAGQTSTGKSGSNGFQDVKRALSAKSRALFAKAAELAVSTDADQSRRLIDELVDASNTVPFVRRALLRAVVGNDTLPAELVRPFMEDTDFDDEVRLVRLWASRGEMPSIVGVLADSWFAPAWLDELPDPAMTLRESAKRLLAAGRPLHPWMLAHPAWFASPEETLSVLPWRLLSDLATGGRPEADGGHEPANGDAVLAEAQRLLADRLGDDGQLWELFTSLSCEFEGTLPELLDLIERI